MANDADTSKATPLDKISGLYDISLDIERHQGDVAFSERGGKIHYAFDENIFELFVFPGEHWTVLDRSPAQELKRVSEEVILKRKVTGAQAALFTAEHLFGGALPGQRNGRLYLTDWHRWELLARMNEVLGSYSNANLAEVRDQVAPVLRRKLEFWADQTREPTKTGIVSDDPYLESDVNALKSELDGAALTSFCRNREVALLLARDTAVEPGQQLSRILAPELQRRLSGLVALDPSRSDLKNSEKLKYDARAWWTSIKREAEFQARSRPRSREANWNDAQSLAVLHWISQTLDPRKDRVVLVTGDQTLFDAYRRHYDSNKPPGGSNVQPFLLRRPIQYSPIFYGGPLLPKSGDGAQLLLRVQQAVEMTLVPVRVAAAIESKTTESIANRRYSATLAPLSKKYPPPATYIDQFWGETGDKHKAEHVNSLTDEIEFWERTLFGLSREYLRRRISTDEEVLFSRAIREIPEDQLLLFDRHIEASVSRLVESAIRIWKPIAERFLARSTQGTMSDTRRPVPIVVPAVLPDQSLDDSLTSFLGHILYSVAPTTAAAATTTALKTPFDVFVAGAVVALRANQWRMAEHFCTIAINASRVSATKYNISPSGAAQAYYLSALAKRFRIGMIAVQDNREGYFSARRLFDEANAALKSSEDYYMSSDRPLVVKLATYKINAERAALSLFFSEFSAAQAENLRGVPGNQEIEAAASAAYLQASEYLLECVRANRSGALNGVVANAGVLMKEQLLINICAWFSIGYVMPGLPEASARSELSRECIRSLPVLSAVVEGKTHRLFLAEVLAFKIAHGIEREDSTRRLNSLPLDDTFSELHLDKRLFKRLVTLVNKFGFDQT